MCNVFFLLLIAGTVYAVLGQEHTIWVKESLIISRTSAHPFSRYFRCLWVSQKDDGRTASVCPPYWETMWCSVTTRNFKQQLCWLSCRNSHSLQKESKNWPNTGKDCRNPKSDRKKWPNAWTDFFWAKISLHLFTIGFQKSGICRFLVQFLESNGKKVQWDFSLIINRDHRLGCLSTRAILFTPGHVNQLTSSEWEVGWFVLLFDPE